MLPYSVRAVPKKCCKRPIVKDHVPPQEAAPDILPQDEQSSIPLFLAGSTTKPPHQTGVFLFSGKNAITKAFGQKSSNTPLQRCVLDSPNF
jgi:hypothetical protein